MPFSKSISFEGGAITGTDAFDIVAAGSVITVADPGDGLYVDSVHVASHSAANDYGQIDISPTVNDAFIWFYLRFSAVSAGSPRLIQLRGSTGSTVAGVSLLPVTSATQYKIRLQQGATTNVGDSTTAMNPNTWYRIGIKFTAGTAGTGVMQCYIATGHDDFGSPEINYTTGTFSGGLGSLRIGSTNTNAFTGYLDDFTISEQAGIITSASPVRPYSRDTDTVAATETAAVSSSTAVSPTDTDTIAVAETSVVVARPSTATDTEQIASTNTATTAKTTTTTDSEQIASTNTSAVARASTRTDTSTITSTNTAATAKSTSTSDTEQIAQTETRAVARASTRTDTEAIAQSETAATARASTRADNEQIASTETATTAKATTATDTDTVTSTNTATTGFSLSAADSDTVASSETGTQSATFLQPDAQVISQIDEISVSNILPTSIDTYAIFGDDEVILQANHITSTVSSLTLQENSSLDARLLADDSTVLDSSESSSTQLLTDTYRDDDSSSISSSETALLVAVLPTATDTDAVTTIEDAFAGNNVASSDDADALHSTEVVSLSRTVADNDQIISTDTGTPQRRTTATDTRGLVSFESRTVRANLSRADADTVAGTQLISIRLIGNDTGTTTSVEASVLDVRSTDADALATMLDTALIANLISVTDYGQMNLDDMIEEAVITQISGTGILLYLYTRKASVDPTGFARIGKVFTWQ